MSGRVLITRPQPGAAYTAKRLEALGYEPLCLPLTEIRALSAEPPAGRNFDAVAVSSANAIRHANAPLLEALAGLPAFAVGRRSAEVAAEAGLAVPAVGPGDGRGLASLIAGRFPPGSNVAYLCGRVRTRGFENALHVAGIDVVPAETYDTIMLDYTDEELSDALGNGAFDAVLLYSRVAAKAFAKLTDRSVMSSRFAGAAFVCMSERVAELIIRTEGKRICIAAMPDEEAMLARLAG